jgi:hypothetical protein
MFIKTGDDGKILSIIVKGKVKEVKEDKDGYADNNKDENNSEYNSEDNDGDN